MFLFIYSRIIVFLKIIYKIISMQRDKKFEKVSKLVRDFVGKEEFNEFYKDATDG